MIDPDIVVQIRAFDQALTERLDDTKFIINDFNGFGVEYEGSDMLQRYTRDPAYGDEKTTTTEMKYIKMMEELCPSVYDIGTFDNYIGVMVKLYNKTNSGGKLLL